MNSTCAILNSVCSGLSSSVPYSIVTRSKWDGMVDLLAVMYAAKTSPNLKCSGNPLQHHLSKFVAQTSREHRFDYCTSCSESIMGRHWLSDTFYVKINPDRR